jgi:hypothetical protein
MLKGLVHAHSGLRWVVLVLLLLAIANAFSGWKKGKSYTAGDRKLHLFAMISVHVQILIGFVLYFLDWGTKVDFSQMKNAMIRFFTVEHIFIMLLAMVVITVGFSRGKRKEDTPRFKFIFTSYLIGLLLILAGIPWPFRELGAGWF